MPVPIVSCAGAAADGRAPANNILGNTLSNAQTNGAFCQRCVGIASVRRVQPKALKLLLAAAKESREQPKVTLPRAGGHEIRLGNL